MGSKHWLFSESQSTQTVSTGTCQLLNSFSSTNADGVLLFYPVDQTQSLAKPHNHQVELLQKNSQSRTSNWQMHNPHSYIESDFLYRIHEMPKISKEVVSANFLSKFKLNFVQIDRLDFLISSLLEGFPREKKDFDTEKL